MLLLAASLFVHLVLTPAASWIGLLGALFPEEGRTPPPPEELDAIPIELLEPDEEPESAPTNDGTKLPEEDPIEVIDELIGPPIAKPAAPAATATTTTSPSS